MLLNALAITIITCITIILGQRLIGDGLTIVSSIELLGLLTSMTALIFGSTTAISHRIAGPIFRLESELGHLNLKNNLAEPITLRKTDQFQELILVYNSALLRHREDCDRKN